MLGKILNIAPGNDPSKSSKTEIYKKGKNRFKYNFKTEDSFKISPAFDFIKKIGWNISAINLPGNNSVKIIFAVEKFEFHVLINLDLIFNLSFINYEIYFRQGEGKTFFSLFRVKFNNKKFSKEVVVSRMEGLKLFAASISGLENEIDFSDENKNYLLNHLLSKINEQLIDDFTYLNNSLLLFLDKLFGVSIEKEKFALSEEGDAAYLLKVNVVR